MRSSTGTLLGTPIDVPLTSFLRRHSPLCVMRRSLKLHEYSWLLARVPSVMAGRNAINLAWLYIEFGPVVMLDMECARNNVTDVLHLAALGVDYRLDAL